MTAFEFTLLILFYGLLSFGLAYGIPIISKFMLKLRIKRKRRLCAKLTYTSMFNSYLRLMSCNEYYKKAKLLEGRLDTRKEQSYYIDLYNDALEELTDPVNLEDIKHMSRKKRKELQRILNLPLPELF